MMVFGVNLRERVEDVGEYTPREKERYFGSFQIPVDSFSEPLAVIGWPSQP